MASRRIAPASWLRAFVAVLMRPRLWWVALRQMMRIARPQWWRRAPFLPLPPADYLRFRLETAYGTDAAPAPDDLVTYLDWCGEWSRVAAAGAQYSHTASRRRR
jgi:hypothetical protein